VIQVEEAVGKVKLLVAVVVEVVLQQVLVVEEELLM
jgi:hypothetical protein